MWYDVVLNINKTSKLFNCLQQKDTSWDVMTAEVQATKNFLTRNRDQAVSVVHYILYTAREIAEEMNVEKFFPSRRARRRNAFLVTSQGGGQFLGRGPRTC